MSKFAPVVIVILLCTSSISFADVKDKKLIMSGLQDKINASHEERYREFLKDLLAVVSTDAPEITAAKDASWTSRTGLCYLKSRHIKEALNRLGKYQIRLIQFDSEADFDHFYLIVDDFSPRIIIDPTYLQMFHYNENTDLNPLFVGTADELVSIFEEHKGLFKPLNPFDSLLDVRYTAEDYVYMVWGYVAEHSPQKVFEIRSGNSFGK